MHYYEVAPNQIIRTGSNVFTYSSPEPYSIGQLVEIPVGKKVMPGLVIQAVKKPGFATKEINKAIESTPLPPHLVSASLWLSEYYATPLASVLQTILPRGLQKNRRQRTEASHAPIRERTNILLNADQQYAVDTISAMPPGSALLHGVTGSGKTQVYIELTRRCIKAGRSAIILVPEIALTSQLIDEFSHHFGDVILTHSRQTEAERHLTWQAVLHATTPQVIIGPRSALFLPVRSLGIIVIDEFHEPSFKQEQSPRYSALRLASTLASLTESKVVFGSATPPVAEYYLAQAFKRPIIHLATQARTDTIKPELELIDMTKRSHFKKHRFLSDILISSIQEALEQNKQALLFHNRRGSASTTLCEHCGWIATCPNCLIPMTLHADTHELRCHICDAHERVPTHCPICQQTDIIFKGIGTKLIESEIKKIFPNKKIARFDADTVQDDAIQHRYKELYDGTIDIIIGTQVVAKGLDLPHLRVVGVIQADAGLVLPDYTSSERTFQLLAQVVGRVGRSHHPTKVIIQSYQPSHPAVQDGITQNYAHFYTSTLQVRKAALFPPYTHLLKLTCTYKTEVAAIKNAREFARYLKLSFASVQILGPTPAFYEQISGGYRWQIVVKSAKRSVLTAIINELPGPNWQFDIDPASLL